MMTVVALGLTAGGTTSASEASYSNVQPCGGTRVSKDL
jgi:hypothetical protein